VIVTGSFNGWNRSSYRMVRRNERWELPIRLAPGKNTYKFIVDGKWILDPGNELWEENEEGTGNSVLWLER
jgi:1,4-alpha-glucan branching enzyme